MNEKKSYKTRPATPKNSTGKVATRVKKRGSAVKKIPGIFPIVGIGASDRKSVV